MARSGTLLSDFGGRRRWFQLIADGRQSSDGEDPTFPCLSTNDAKLPSNDVGRLSNNTKLLPAYYTTVPDSRHGPGYFTAFLWFLGASEQRAFLLPCSIRAAYRGDLLLPASIKRRPRVPTPLPALCDQQSVAVDGPPGRAPLLGCARLESVQWARVADSNIRIADLLALQP